MNFLKLHLKSGGKPEPAVCGAARRNNSPHVFVKRVVIGTSLAFLTVTMMPVWAPPLLVDIYRTQEGDSWAEQGANHIKAGLSLLPNLGQSAVVAALEDEDPAAPEPETK